MKEIGPAKPQKDPGECFYTIRPADLYMRFIETEIGPVDIGPLIGRVTESDLGHRVYRLNLGDSGYIWQFENNKQYRERTEGKHDREQNSPQEEGLV